MLTLYGSNNTRSFRALWALEEAGLEYDYQQVRLGRTGKNSAQSKSYTQLNFQGKVPTLVDNDLVITESAAILNYIATLVPDKKLIPLDDIKLRAHYDQLCFLVMSELEQPLWTTAKHNFALPKEFRLAGIDKTTQWEFARAVGALNSLIRDKEFSVNEHFTMVDILITHTLHWAHNNNFEVPKNLQNYSERMYQRSACQRALTAQQTVK
jgi:glutathione S-transferase